MDRLMHSAILWSGLMGLLFSSCTTWYVDAYRVTAQRYPKRDTVQVAVRESTPAPDQFTPIAFLEYNRDFSTEGRAHDFRATKQRQIVTALQRKAATLGADAIVHIQNADGPACQASRFSVYGVWRLVTRGLAVKLAK